MYKFYDTQEYMSGSKFESTDVYAMAYPDGTIFLIPPLSNKVRGCLPHPTS